jgi:hypothetical protein
MIQAFSTTVGGVLWPLYVKDAFGWTQREFSYVLFGSSLLSTSLVAAAPTLEAVWGRIGLQVLASTTAALAAGLAFTAQVRVACGGRVTCDV